MYAHRADRFKIALKKDRVFTGSIFFKFRTAFLGTHLTTPTNGITLAVLVTIKLLRNEFSER